MRNFLLIIFVLWTLTSFSQDTSTLEFAQVYYNNAWRIIDRKGNFILNQEYGVDSYQSMCFSDGLAISFTKKGKFGFTDFSNKQVIPNKFDAAQCFVLGYAPVAVGNKWGIINKECKFVVEPKYDYVGAFGFEKVAAVMRDNKISLVDTSGKLVAPFKYYWSRSFATYPDYPFFINGLIAVIDAKDPEKIYEGKTGCLNTRGELVIPAIYDYIGYFDEGIASASKDGKIVLIDTLGNVVLEPKEVDYGVLYFQNGYSVFHKRAGGTGIIKRSGEIILESKYAGVNAFSEGFAAVQIGGDEKGVKSGYIDTTGKFVFNKTFGFIRDFHEGLAGVEINGKWGFIDTTGKTILQPKYFDVQDFQDGLAVVGIKTGKQIKYGFIDKTGKFFIKPIYNEARPFDFGLAAVKIGSKFGFIDKTGKVIIQPRFVNAFGFRRETLGWTQ